MTTTISVTPGYIGQKTSADKSNILTYSITTDGTMSDITEKINGVTIATRTNPTSGQNFTVSLSQEQWDAIKYGNAHALTIEMGDETWTYTFDKRLHANDDILSAVKGVQDLQTHLNGIKAQLGAAIRAKGGTVNDTDAWSAFVSAVSNMQVKRFLVGTATSSSTQITFINGTGGTKSFYYITVTGLPFKPSKILIYRNSDGLPMTAIDTDQALYNGYNMFLTYDSSIIFRLTGNANITSTGFTLPANSQSTVMKWVAIE